ncbi:MAG: hypothetical protein KF850_14725 [Labilithrix sp.]|nr:hypothetical protein [Labilithrix sp.]
MANRSNRSELPRLFSGRAVFVAFVTLSVVTGACSSDERRIAIGAGETDEDAGALAPPRFDGPEDAGDASSTTSDASREGIAMCVATECPYPFGTCGGTSGTNNTYACGTNLLADRNNCGTCGNACPQASAFPELNMDTQCVDGACQRQCVPRSGVQYGDCNGLVDDGCETNLGNDPDHCGACGNACPAGPDGARRCINGQCGCPIGQTWCDSVGCTDTAIDDTNCGACGNVCQGTDAGPPPPNMEYRCLQGKCAQLRCSSGRADCNGKIQEDGCEVDIVSDSKNCGACGNVCPPGQRCLPKGNIVACGCEPLETLCQSGGREFCADLLNDTRNCGACGYTCPSKGGYVAACRKGFCEYDCPPGRGDCDGNIGNGCETDLTINGRHCGACGNQCDTAAGQPCISGSCLMVECDGGVVTK